jgi:2-dehydro-3-deoxygluconokinase
MAIDVVTLGECMALVYPHELVSLSNSELLCLDIAGAESNLCIGLSRLGHTTRFISRVGHDPLGDKIRDILQREGVFTDALFTDYDAPTGIFFREHLPDGQRRVYYYRSGSAASRMNIRDINPELFKGAKIVHLTGITPALSVDCAAASMKAVEIARQVGALISFDPNFRPRLWDAQTALLRLRPFILNADILLMGHEDAVAVLGIIEENDVLEYASRLGPKIVVLKQAERGATAWAEGRFFHVPAYPADKVVDPVGAGDGFDAGFLSAYLRGANLDACLELGARVGAAAVTVQGDYHGYPYLKDIL